MKLNSFKSITFTLFFGDKNDVIEAQNYYKLKINNAEVKIGFSYTYTYIVHIYIFFQTSYAQDLIIVED